MNTIRAALFLAVILGTSWLLYAPKDDPAPIIATEEDATPIAPPPPSADASVSVPTRWATTSTSSGYCSISVGSNVGGTGSVPTYCVGGGGPGVAYGGGGGGGYMITTTVGGGGGPR